MRELTAQEWGIGELDHAAAVQTAVLSKLNFRKEWVKYTSVERCDIEKYVSKIWTAAVLKL